MLELKLENLTWRIKHIIQVASSAASLEPKDTLEYKTAEEFLQSFSNFYEKKESVFALKERIVGYEPQKPEILELERNKEREQSSSLSFKKNLLGALVSASAYMGTTLSLYDSVNSKVSLVGFIFLIPTIYLWSKADAAKKDNYESSDKRKKLESYIEKQKKKHEQVKRELQLYPEWMYYIALNQNKESILAMFSHA